MKTTNDEPGDHASSETPTVDLGIFGASTEQDTGPQVQTPELPDHLILKRIGGGGAGDVYLAQNRHDKHFCAVKLIRESADSELAGLQHFKSCVADHDSLVQIEHVGRVGDLVYCVMPLADQALEGGPVQSPIDYVPMTLSRRIRRSGRVPAEEVAAIGHALGQGLVHMHGKGAVHGDLKPDNVFLVGGRWCLGDYGLVSDTDLRKPRGFTPGFVGPEGGGTPESDAFALGVTILLLLSGQYHGDAASLLEAQREICRSELEHELLDVAAALITREPSRRATVQEATEALGKLAGPSAAPSSRSDQFRRLAPSLIRLGCATAALVPAGVLLIQRPPPFPTLTLIVGLAAGLISLEVALATARYRPIGMRWLVVAAVAGLVSWTAYTLIYDNDLLVHRTPRSWDQPRVYQIGFHMQPWTFTSEARARIDDRVRHGKSVDDPHDVIMLFGYEGQSTIMTIWKPWTVICAGAVVVATFGVGWGLWAAFCTGLACRLVSELGNSGRMARPAPARRV